MNIPHLPHHQSMGVIWIVIDGKTSVIGLLESIGIVNYEPLVSNLFQVK